MDLLKSKIFPLLSLTRKFLANFRFFVSKTFSKIFGKNSANTFNNSEADKKLVYSLSRSRIPSTRQLKYLGKVLNKKEVLFIQVLSFLVILNIAWLFFNLSGQHLKVVPMFGGEYSEGLIGEPQHINPLYASVNDADADIARLVYSSLFKLDKNGEPQKDLVSDYQISDDGKVYTFKLRDNAKWTDGSPVTADDVIFTLEAIKNPDYNSPLRSSLNGVEADKIDDKTVTFTVTEKYAPFLSILTFGILPSAIWEQIAPGAASLAELNLKPIGSGPYKFKSLVKDKAGNIRSYTLTANKSYYGNAPHVKDFVFKFYSSFTEAVASLNANEVDGLSYLPKEEKDNLIAKNSLSLEKLNLPILKAAFFNGDSNAVLKDLKVRQALAYASPRADIIKNILNNEVAPAYGPISVGSFAYNDAIEQYNFDFNRAQSLLVGDGWQKETVTPADIVALQARQDNTASKKDALSSAEKDKLARGAGDWLYKDQVVDKKAKVKTTARTYLTFSLTALNNDEDTKVTQALKASWEKLGAKVTVKLVDASQIESTVIKTRQYDVLLFSQSIGSDPDVYVFWHSSQVGANGLNLANYKNEEADKMLEEGRLALNRDERVADYKKFQEIVANDAPAIFLYSPYYVYPQAKKLKGFDVKNISSPQDRFADIEDWFITSGRKIVW